MIKFNDFLIACDNSNILEISLGQKIERHKVEDLLVGKNFEKFRGIPTNKLVVSSFFSISDHKDDDFIYVRLRRVK